MTKPRIRVINNDKTVTFLNLSNNFGFKVVANNEIKKAESFAELFLARQAKSASYGGICKKNAHQWLELMRIG